MTAKFDSFVSALRDLCREHGVVLSTSMDDSIQVWDDHTPDKDPLYVNGIEDATMPAEEQESPENLQIVKVKANRKAKEQPK